MSAFPSPDQGGYAGRRVLITGGLGFIGSTLAARLVREGAFVTIVDSLIPEYGGLLANVAGIEDQVKVNISDVRDEQSMLYLVQGQDYLFNLAGQTSHMDSMADPYTDLEINSRAQLSILEACRKRSPEIKIVFASTRQIYGRPDYLPVDERHLVRPVDVNGINKTAGESYHLVYNAAYGLRTCALRLTNTYGPRMRVKDARQTFLGIWIRRVLEDDAIEVWGGGQLRDFTYVDDAVEALIAAGLSAVIEGRALNVGGLDPPVTLAALADLVVALAGQGRYVVKEFPADRRRIDIGDYVADDSELRRVTGWRPRTDLQTGLAETIAYYRAHLDAYL